jgi:multiple sugar transport system permease protein
VNDVLINGDAILLGTGSGLSILKPATGEIKNYTELFAFLEGEKVDPKRLSQSEVFSVAYDFRKVYLGTTRGRISLLDLGLGKVAATGVLNHGHTIVRWRNYVDMWKNIDFGLYLRNSIIICGIATLIAMILATLAAYSLARFNFPGSKTFSMTILVTQMIPAIMYLIPIFITFVKITEFTGIPMKGTYYGIILVYSAFFVPFSIWILRGFFAAIPKELEEAARIDGCSPIQVFWYVVLPLAIPGIIATGVYIFLTAWDELMFAWVLTNADTMTIPVGIRNFVGNYQNRFDLMMAAASVATIPVLVLFFLLQKYIVKGLTAGAVKG